MASSMRKVVDLTEETVGKVSSNEEASLKLLWSFIKSNLATFDVKVFGLKNVFVCNFRTFA